jgi:hypothetical protein
VFMYILIPQSSEQKSIICAKGRQMGMPTWQLAYHFIFLVTFFATIYSWLGYLRSNNVHFKMKHTNYPRKVCFLSVKTINNTASFEICLLWIQNFMHSKKDSRYHVYIKFVTHMYTILHA